MRTFVVAGMQWKTSQPSGSSSTAMYSNSSYAPVMERVNGVPVTDEMVQEWADEAERGYDVETLCKRGRGSGV